MSRALPRPEAVRRFAVICFGLSRRCAHQQPWHVAQGMAEGLAALGHDVLVLTDAADPPDGSAYTMVTVNRLFTGGCVVPEAAAALADFAPERIFLFTGAARLARLSRGELVAPISLVVTSPRWRPSELLALGAGRLWRERRLLALPLLDALLPAALLRWGWRRSGADDVVYLSGAAQSRYAALGLPLGRRLTPQVSARPIERATPAGAPVVAYVGPALESRGVDLALSAFEAAVASGTQARLLMLLRSDGPVAATRRVLRRCARSPCRDLISCETSEFDAAGLRRRLADAHAFILPFQITVSEAPLVVIEAGLSGRPVIVLDRPGVSELARAFGGTVVASEADLPHALALACRHPTCRLQDPASWTRWDRAVSTLLEPPTASAHDLAMVALIGADGSGKTCLADALARHFDRAAIPQRRVWSRFRNYLSRPLLAVTRLTGHNRKELRDGVRVGYHDFAGHPLLAHMFLACQLVDLALDVVLRFRWRRHELILADRCALDTLVDLAVDTGLDRLIIDRLARPVAALLPQPLQVIAIERPVALVAMQRPDALADRHFARRRVLYRSLAHRLRIPVVVNARSVDDAVVAIERVLSGPSWRRGLVP